MSKEAMKLALEALKKIDDAMPFPVGKSAIKALEEALAKQEQKGDQLSCYCPNCEILGKELARIEKQANGEPVAWQWLTTAHFRKKLPKDAEKGAWNPLYTTPQQRTWVGLSREDCYQVRENESDDFMYGVAWAEAKLKEKNCL